MKKKTSLLKLFIFTLGIAPSFSLFPSYRPAGKRPLKDYKGPMPAAPIVKSIQKQPIETMAPAEAQKKELEDIEKEESEEAEPKSEQVSDTKEAQKNLARPGFLASMYAAFAPLVLVTLDGATSKGIAESTKSIIDDSIARGKYQSFRSDLLSKVNKNIKPEFKNISDEEKLKEGKKSFLTEKEAKLFNRLEKQTTVPAIAAQAAHIFILNTFANFMATLFGYTIKVGLSHLMPDQK